MQLHFTLHYHCHEGEHLRLHLAPQHSNCHSTPLSLSQSIALTSTDGYHWQSTITLNEDETTVLRYGFALWRDEECLRSEYQLYPHTLFPLPTKAEWQITDAWQDELSEAYLYSQAFTTTLTQHPQPPLSSAEAALCLRACVPALSFSDWHLALVGEGEDLGNWQAEGAVPLSEIAPHRWHCTLPLSALQGRAYKFVVLDKEGKIRAWESGDNRLHTHLHAQPGEMLCLPEVQLSFPGCQPRVAGTAVPVFSLRSRGSQGVGDFGDLRLMLDWLTATGQKALQILPINDTQQSGTFLDSYPYNAISIFALHPIYIDLRQCPSLHDSDKAQHFERIFRQLNALPDWEYETCHRHKMTYLRLLFAQEGAETLASTAFAQFFAQNQDWLVDYARFCVLRDTAGTAHFHTWQQHSLYDATALAQWETQQDNTRLVQFYYFLQFLLDAQLRAVATQAHERGILLKGDIPIGISPSSVEAWREPALFHTHQQAGAPPDAFATEGQNWGFPTYNWERMHKDSYAWWRRRFAKMADYFSAYRIDHILGFFRIWEIPQHSVQGLLGHFSPALPLSWAELQAAGLTLPKDFMLRPFINDELLQRLFSPRQNEWVKTHCLQHAHHDIWHLRPEWNTQRQIEAQLSLHAAQLPTAEISALRRGLFALTCNVLFIEDETQPDHFHPRICGTQTQVFERLQSREKAAYHRLYEDFYYHRHHDFWRQSALRKLPTLLTATAMLACGEDLGMVPDCVPAVMQQLNILSLEIERMPKAYGATFGCPADYPRTAVCTIGTHDMATLRGWWTENTALSTRYYYEQLGHGGPVPTTMHSDLAAEIIDRHLASPALLTILALQDWLALDDRLCPTSPEAERINVPANPQHQWKYRMPFSIETLLEQKDFNTQMRKRIQQHQR